MVKNNLATKEDIRRLEGRVVKVKKGLGGLKSDIVDMKVKVLGELKDFREDFAVH